MNCGIKCGSLNNNLFCTVINSIFYYRCDFPPKFFIEISDLGWVVLLECSKKIEIINNNYYYLLGTTCVIKMIPGVAIYCLLKVYYIFIICVVNRVFGSHRTQE